MTKSRSEPMRVRCAPIQGGVHFTVNGRSVNQSMTAQQLFGMAEAFLRAGLETMRMDAKPMTATEVLRRQSDALRRMPQRGRL